MFRLNDANNETMRDVLLRYANAPRDRPCGAAHLTGSGEMVIEANPFRSLTYAGRTRNDRRRACATGLKMNGGKRAIAWFRRSRKPSRRATPISCFHSNSR